MGFLFYILFRNKFKYLSQLNEAQLAPTSTTMGTVPNVGLMAQKADDYLWM